MRLREQPDQELWDLANPIMDNLMDGSTDIDHARHCRDFTRRLRDIVTPDYLETVCRKYQSEKGFFAERVPVELFRRPDSVAFVWRQHFTLARGDYVAEMVLVEQDGRLLVDHVMVF